MYETILDVIHNFWKNGLTLSACGTALYYFLRHRRVKRRIKKLIPWVHLDEADVANYEARQIRIEEKIDALMSAGGVTWDADWKSGRHALSQTDGAQPSSSRLQEAYARAAITGAFIQLKVLFHLQRRSNRMLKKLDSRKLQMILVPTIINICLLAGFMLNVQDIQEKVESWTPLINLVVQAILGIAYAIVEGKVDVAKAKAGAEYDLKNLDSVRSDSIDV